MHLQISGSPGDTASNIRAIVIALTQAGVNIEGISPDSNPPHVRVAVQHGEPYDPNDPNDPFNVALNAMEAAGLAPVIKPAVTVALPNTQGALKKALIRLMKEGYATESILVLSDTRVQFGVAPATLTGWATESDRLSAAILADFP